MLAVTDPSPGSLPDATGAGLLTKRTEVLGVGVVTLDILLEVTAFPREDQELRAAARHRRRGGNAANTLAVLSQLGHRAAWVGVIGDDADAHFVLGELDRCGVEHRFAQCRAGAGVPTSYVCLSQSSGSRTIVHHRDLPELTAAELARVPLAGYDWIHFEGRNPKETAAMLRHARRERPGATLSLELEKPRPGIEALFEGPDVLLIGKDFAKSAGATHPEAFLREMIGRTTAAHCFLAWGAGGSYAIGADGRFWHRPAFVPARVVDTLGAGDVFNAGVIHALLGGLAAEGALQFACRLAGRKCGRLGLEQLCDGQAEPT